MLQSQELRIEQQNSALNVESYSTNVAFKKGGQSRGNGAYHGGNHHHQQSNRGNYNNIGGRGRG